MKKLLTFIIIGLLSILVVACGSNERKQKRPQQNQVEKLNK